MRILYFLAHPEGIGGASSQMLTHARIMADSGHEVCVVIQNDADGYHNPIIDTLCDSYGVAKCECKYSIATCIENIDIFDCIEKSDNIKKLIDEFNPDIVHSLQINTAVELASRECGVPHVMSIYPLAEGMFNLNWENVFPRYLIGDSLYYTDQWGKGLGTTTKCIRVCYKPKNAPKKIIQKECDFSLLTMGVLTPYKNQLEIIKFTEKLINDGVKAELSILGNCSTSYGTECINYVKEHKLENYVKFNGFVVGVEEYLGSADVLIHASFKDSYPGAIVEAMANKTPVITYPTGGIPELIKDDQNGILLRGTTAEDIYDAFKRYILLRKNGKLSGLIDNAYNTYVTNHTEKAVMSGLMDLYNEMLDNKDQVEYKQYCCDKWMSEFVSGRFVHLSNFSKRHLWYLKHIKVRIDEAGYNNAIIWGAGNYGAYAYEWCKILGIKPNCFVDTNKTGEYQGLTISEPNDDVLSSADIVFIAIGNTDVCREINGRLGALGRIRNKDYFFLNNDSCM